MFNAIERFLFGESWVYEYPFMARLLFARDCALWPTLHRKTTLELHMQSQIDQERKDGKYFCATQKLKRCLALGLDVN
jgi:hypothetical protein